MDIFHTKPRVYFKKQCGNTNHFLITLIVGCEAGIENPEFVKPALNAAWNPKNQVRSFKRAQNFALRATLAWVIDCLDAYTYHINRKPYNYLTYLSNQQDKIKNELDKNERSVSKRVEELSKHFGIDGRNTTLVKFGIELRNFFVHSATKETTVATLERLKKKLLADRQYYEEHFCHLNVEEMTKCYLESREPTLKEIASLVSVMISFVDEIDRAIIRDLEIDKYAQDCLKDMFHLAQRKTKTKEKEDYSITKEFASENETYIGACKRFREKLTSLQGNRQISYVARVLQERFCIDASDGEVRALIQALKEN